MSRSSSNGLRHCFWCDHTWYPRQGTPPRQCPNCGTRAWQRKPPRGTALRAARVRKSS